MILPPTMENIRSERRDQSIVNARQVAMYIMRETADLSLIDIGKIFGGKTHSTVKHSVDEVEKKMLSNAKQILVSELVLAENQSRENVEKMIDSRIDASFNSYLSGIQV